MYVVGGETRRVRAGEAVTFDDAFEHAVSNVGLQPRIVFALASWHPDIVSPCEYRRVLCRPRTMRGDS